MGVWSALDKLFSNLLNYRSLPYYTIRGAVMIIYVCEMYCFTVALIFINEHLKHQLCHDDPELKILALDRNDTRFGDQLE